MVGAAPVDDAAFDRLAGSLDPAMVIVTAAADGETAGCLVGFHAQASIGPRHYAVWLSTANHTYRVALLAQHLGVHVLTTADGELAALFGTRSGDDVDKLDLCEWSAGPEGVPILAACPHHLVLRRTGLLDGHGDHVGFVGEVVVAVTAGSFEPLRLSAVADLTPGHEADDPPAAGPRQAP